MLKISQLWVYPIKSCQGVQVKTIELLPSGLKDDRSMMIVDEKGRFVTQRSDAVLAHIGVALHNNTITLSYRDNQFAFSRQYTQKVSAIVWKREVPAFDQGDSVADFLTKIIGRKVRLLATRPSDTDDCKIIYLLLQKIRGGLSRPKRAQLYFMNFVSVVIFPVLTPIPWRLKKQSVIT